MLPEKVQEFLGACGYQTKKGIPKVLTGLSEKRNFNEATEAIRATISHGAQDVDSVLAIFNRLSSDIIDLDPLVFPADVPKIPPAKVDVDNYDNWLLKGGKACEN